MSLQEVEAPTLDAFKSSVEDLALVELVRLQADHEALSKRLAEVTEGIKSVKAVLRAANGRSNSGPPKTGGKRRANDSGSGFTMSEEREAQIIAWLTGNESEITSHSLREHFPTWSGSYCNMALKLLRERNGVLRLAATSGSMNIYRSLI